MYMTNNGMIHFYMTRNGLWVIVPVNGISEIHY